MPHFLVALEEVFHDQANHDHGQPAARCGGNVEQIVGLNQPKTRFRTAACPGGEARTFGTLAVAAAIGFRQKSQPAVDLILRDPENLGVARILVVDDELAVQETIRLVLERAGHSVVTASDGRNCIALCQGGDFDLLFLDIFMPGMDGFETMRLVRERQPQLPIVVISGRPVAWAPEQTPDFLTMATKLGAVSSLQKPFRPADLLAAVARGLDASGGVATSP